MRPTQVLGVLMFAQLGEGILKGKDTKDLPFCKFTSTNGHVTTSSSQDLAEGTQRHEPRWLHVNPPPHSLCVPWGQAGAEGS